jgi:hypothetical protein
MELVNLNTRERERQKRYSGFGGVMRHYVLGRIQKNIPALKVPRQCPLVLPVEVWLRQGKALGSEEGKELG